MERASPFTNPWTIVLRAPLSMEFFRQEYWSGLPFPSPELAVWYHHLFCCCLVTKSRPTLCDPMDCSPPGSSVHGILQARILEWVAMPTQGLNSGLLHWQADSLSLSHQGSPSSLFSNKIIPNLSNK